MFKSLLLLFSFVIPDDQAIAQEEVRAAAHRSLLVEYFTERSKGMPLRWEYFAPRFLREAEDNTGDAVGFDSLSWLVMQCSEHSGGFKAIEPLQHPESFKALDLLKIHYSKRSDIKDLCQFLVSPAHFGSQSSQVEALLLKVIAENPEADVRAEAGFSLAQFLENKSEVAQLIQSPANLNLARRLEGYWGNTYIDHLKGCNAADIYAQASHLREISRRKHPQYWESRVNFGKQAPEIEGEDVDGKFMKLSEHRGKVVMLTFWGTWCLPCRAMFPQERDLVKRMDGKPFVLLGVDNDKDRGKPLAMIRDEQLSWRSWWDVQPECRISRSWSVSSYPTTYVLDHRGAIRYRDLHGIDLDIAVEITVNCSMAIGR